MEAIRKYLEAINTEIKLKYNMPIDINKYVDNIEKLPTIIECFWNIFSVENCHYLINIVYGFTNMIISAKQNILSQEAPGQGIYVTTTNIKHLKIFVGEFAQNWWDIKFQFERLNIADFGHIKYKVNSKNYVVQASCSRRRTL